jgi:galactose mutarotase-like enzyme
MITFQNSKLSVTVRPDLGGRIDSIKDLSTDREWLYHPKNYNSEEPRNLPIGASFDENWSGGWDEIFPNDAAGEFQSHLLVDHGELWSQGWEVVEKSLFGVQMFYRCQTVPVTVEKAIFLDPKCAQVNISYLFKNLSQQAIPFLFKMHAALAVEMGDEILLPDCDIEPVDLNFSHLIGQAGKTKFPKAFDQKGNPIDVSRVPPIQSQSREFYYCSNLAEGRCGLRNRKTNSSLVMKFDSGDFPFVWNFQSFGGWSDHYMVVLEPCTTLPWNLEKALENKTCAVLMPGQVQERHLSFGIEGA